MLKKTYNKDLPDYTKGEEIFNAVSHIVGGGFGVIALALGVVMACIHSNAYGIVSMAIYGASMILLYTMSAIYHFLRRNRAKKVFRIFDHCTIFLLIAGTYTPFCLVTLREAGAWGWSLFGIVWFFAILGIGLTIFIFANTNEKNHSGKKPCYSGTLCRCFQGSCKEQVLLDYRSCRLARLP